MTNAVIHNVNRGKGKAISVRDMLPNWDTGVGRVVSISKREGQKMIINMFKQMATAMKRQQM